MQINYLEEFIEVANRRSFSRAARELHVTQPVLSKHIQAIEKELNAQLFVRNSHVVELTAAGRVVLAAAENISSVWENAVREVSSTRNRTNIVVGGNTRSDFILSLIGEVAANVSYEIRLSKFDNLPMLDAVEQSLLDAAFIVLPDDEGILAATGKLFDLVPVCSEPLYALMSANHPLAREESLTIAHLENWPLVRISEGYGSDSVWKSFEHLCLKRGFVPRSKLYFHENETLYLNDELFLLPRGEVERALKRISGKTLAIPLVDEDARIDVYMATKGEGRAPAIDDFAGRIAELVDGA